MNENRKVYERPVAVAGSTGKQGGAVARLLLERGHKVRALSRNPDKEVARELAASGADVVRADLEDRSSLDTALQGAAAVFSVQDFLEAGVEAELRQGLNLTAAAQAAGVEHLDYSGASTIDRNTGVPHLDSKWRVEQAVRATEVPWTIFRPAAFMENWEWDRESILNDGVVSLPLQAQSVYRQVSVREIAAMAVLALEQPEIWKHQIVALSGDNMTPADIARTFERVVGRLVQYSRLSWEACREAQGEELTKMYRYFDTYGMDGDPGMLRRWVPEALSFEGFLRDSGWDQPAS